MKLLLFKVATFARSLQPLSLRLQSLALNGCPYSLSKAMSSLGAANEFSGFVSFDRIAAIFACRCYEVKYSMIIFL